MPDPAGSGSSRPAARDDRDLASVQEARTLARRAKEAAGALAELSQEQIDALVDAMAAAVTPHAEALALLAHPVWMVWLLATAVGLASLLAVVLTVDVAVPAVGPLPRVFEPVWSAEKVAAAAATSLAGLAGLRLAGRSLAPPASRSALQQR